MPKIKKRNKLNSQAKWYFIRLVSFRSPSHLQQPQKAPDNDRSIKTEMKRNIIDRNATLTIFSVYYKKKRTLSARFSSEVTSIKLNTQLLTIYLTLTICDNVNKSVFFVKQNHSLTYHSLMNSQLKTKLKISTTCKHTDLLYVSATAQYLYLYIKLYITLSLYLCVIRT